MEDDHSNTYYDIMTDEQVYQNMPKNRPPRIGDYAYYDSRLMNDNKSYNSIDISKHWLIGVNDSQHDCGIGCHFSSPWLHHFKSYITTHNRIVRVKSDE
tara:strand:- start:1447 stop:1743 length:297 start_codon:yes stop_codon:yes gene_type:complete